MATMDLAKILDDLDRRATRLEQWISNPNAVVTSGSDATFDTITIGSGGGSVTLDSVTPGTPTGLSLSSGAFFDVIYVDSDWTLAVGDTQTVEYEIEISKKIAGVYQLAHIQRTIGSNFRYEPVEPNTTYGFRVRGVSRTGKFGAFTAWVDITTGQDATIPPVVTGLSAFRGATSVIVKFDPLTAAQAPDVANGEGLYEIQVDTANTFNTGNLRTVRSTASIVAFSDIFTEGTWYARVSAIDTSGNQGGWSAVVSTTAGGVVDSMVVAGLSAAKITVGEMSGDRIDVNTLNVNRLLDASTITSKTINIGAGGQFKIGDPTGGSGTSGIFINDQGIRLYKDGSPTVTLDALTGTGTFTGTVSGSTITGSNIYGAYIEGGLFTTGLVGAGVEISSSPFSGVTFYTGHASETTPAKIIGIDSGGTPVLRIEGPRLSGGGAPQPYIDLAGGAGTAGTISINANTAIAVTSGGTLTLTGAGISHTFDSSGFSLGGTMRMNNNTIKLRGTGDTDAIYWTNNQINYTASSNHYFYTAGFSRAYFDANGIHTPQYSYAWGDAIRMGELYSNAVGLYAVNNALRLDSSNSSIRLSIGGVNKISCHSNGYTYLHTETSIEGNSFFLKAANDYNQRVYYHSGFDGVVLTGWVTAALQSAQWDCAVEAGRFANRTRHVNQASSAWRDSDAAVHNNNSDPRFKRDIVPIEALAKVVGGKPEKVGKKHLKEIKPIKFRWLEGTGSDDREHFGFDADELPPEITFTTRMAPGSPLGEESKMYDPAGMTALLWQAVRELSEEVEELKSQLQPA